MALVVLLRGVNVGGHRVFRPAALAAHLKHLDAVNIGAAGTLVIRRPVSRTRLRAELRRRMPFAAEMMICEGREIVRLASRDFFRGRPVRRDLLQFVSVLSRRPRSSPSMPIRLPGNGRWLLKVLTLEDRFVVGVYRREMRAITCLGTLDRVFGVPATTRGWTTIKAIAAICAHRRRQS